jgi:tetratricopeptide (TPR) repeat protein
MPKNASKAAKQPASVSRATYSIYDFRLQAIILLIVGLIFYANSFSNQYALDDGIVIEKNDHVQKGFKGIKKILSTDAYESFYRQMNAKQQLSGGRYRPLSIVTFAIEQQLFGDDDPKADGPDDLAFVRHFVNVLLYILSCIALLFLLHRFVFKGAPLLALLCSLLFLIHPLHTEVVANVKSRDEIMSMLFIALTFICVYQFRQHQRKRFMIGGLLCYFFALLSKEYAITLVVLIPMLLMITDDLKMRQAVIATLPYVVVAVVYLLIRFSVVGVGSTQENPDVLNNPFKYATATEKLATKIEILTRYLKLLFWPFPLSSDYSYSTIPYTNFSNPVVWFSIIVHAGMIAAAVLLFLKRHLLAFALAFYLFHLALVSNLFMDIGATMGERLVYHSSFGFVLIIGWLIYYLSARLPERMRRPVIAGVMTLASVLSATVVIPRNAEWENDSTLFIADAQKVPNSALANGNAGKAYIDLSEKPENKAREKELLLKSIPHLERAITIHKDYVNGHLNLGVTYFKLEDYEKAEKCWLRAREIYPNNPYLKINFGLLANVYFNRAMKIGEKNPQEAIKLLERSTTLDPSNAELWYNLGGANYTIGNFDKAREAWTKTLMLNPGHVQAQQGMSALTARR